MTVDGVNNSNSNAGLYAAGVATLGAGAGVGTAYLTRPFLKDGAPTDTFLRKIEENTVKIMKEDEKKLYVETLAKLEKFEKIKNIEELKEFIKNDEQIKAGYKLLGMSMEDVFAEIDVIGFEKAKAEFKQGIDLVIGAQKEVVKDAFKFSWDSVGKKFKQSEAINDEGFQAVKKAARSIQNKYAMIYGAIGAGVLGLGTYLCCAGKKQTSVEKSLNE